MRLAIHAAVASLAGALLLLAGCAASNQKLQANSAAPAELPGISAYYAQATAHHRRAVRKPIRDQQTYALREIARSANALLAQTETWDSGARLASLPEEERDTRREASEEFRAALRGLKAAAEKSDMAALQSEYARATACYQQIRGLAGPAQ